MRNIDDIKNEEAKALIQQLPEYMWDQIVLCYPIEEPNNPYIALESDDMEKFYLPSNPDHLAIFDRLTEIAREEHAEYRNTSYANILDMIGRRLRNENDYASRHGRPRYAGGGVSSVRQERNTYTPPSRRCLGDGSS